MGVRAVRCSRAQPFIKGLPGEPRLRAKALVKTLVSQRTHFRGNFPPTKSLGSEKELDLVQRKVPTLFGYNFFKKKMS